MIKFPLNSTTKKCIVCGVKAFLNPTNYWYNSKDLMYYPLCSSTCVQLFNLTPWVYTEGVKDATLVLISK